MCKRMMQQRADIEAVLNKDLERCLEGILKTGRVSIPRVRVDLDELYIANREYFEHEGFIFEAATRIEKNQIKYYAWLRLGGEGTLANQYWKKIKLAEADFVNHQRQKISDQLRETGGGYYYIEDISGFRFENKLYFEERGYFFEPVTIIKNGTALNGAHMRKRKR